ncbi:MAG: ABC transporter permease subunit, partial [Armatimonadota bacterium]
VPVITRRELSAYFLSPIAYVVLTAFALMQGILWSLSLGPRIDPAMSCENALAIPMYLLVLAAPVITMRLLSEETSRGTIETLMTTPVTEVEVVLGKFVGALVFAVAMFLPILGTFIFLRLLGPWDTNPVLSGALGLFLLTAQFISIGLLCSALTRIQIASAIMSFAILIGLYFLWFLGRESEAAWARLLRYLSPPWHYFGFLKGVVDTRDLTYFAVTTVIFLFLTVRALQLRKWR